MGGVLDELQIEITIHRAVQSTDDTDHDLRSAKIVVIVNITEAMFSSPFILLIRDSEHTPYDFCPTRYSL